VYVGHFGAQSLHEGAERAFGARQANPARDWGVENRIPVAETAKINFEKSGNS
jgi:hypothetical protein